MAEHSLGGIPLGNTNKKSKRSLKKRRAGTIEATGGGSDEIQWEVVVRTMGLMEAKVIAGRLEAEGIPTHVWQEGAGAAFGLTVGLLGTGYVMVPEEVVDKALAILERQAESDEANE